MKYPAYVYVLLVGATGKVYIGLSANPKARFARHKSLLLAGKHPVEDMQADYDALEDKYLNYVVVEEVRTPSERFKEHKWQTVLRSYERGRGYNYKDPTVRTGREEHERRKHFKEVLRTRMLRI